MALLGPQSDVAGGLGSYRLASGLLFKVIITFHGSTCKHLATGLGRPPYTSKGLERVFHCAKMLFVSVKEGGLGNS